MTGRNQRYTKLGRTAVLLVFILGCLLPNSVTASPIDDLKSWFSSLLGGKSEKAASPPVQAADRSGLHQTFSTLQIPCGYIVATKRHDEDPSTLVGAPVTPISTRLDPSKKGSSISRNIVQGDRYLTLLSEEGGMPGYVPAEAVYLRMGSLEATVFGPAFEIVDREEGFAFDLELGRDFMEQNKAALDLEEMEVHIQVGGKAVMIPFIQNRESQESAPEEPQPAAEQTSEEL
eukprot:Nitzschia sp. Nitz4//scaffold28_size193895//128893//129588//NITZ4_001672-RA/size193895-processed-gene-0.32-mRNA-1//1//CDS//3329546003//154//frame0